MREINKSDIAEILKKHFKKQFFYVIGILLQAICFLGLIIWFILNYYKEFIEVDKDIIVALVFITATSIVVSYEAYFEGIAPVLDYILMDIVETPDLTGCETEDAIYGLSGFYGKNKVLGFYIKVIYPNNKKVSLKKYNGTIKEKEHGVYRYRYLRRSKIIVGYVQVGTPPKKRKK